MKIKYSLSLPKHDVAPAKPPENNIKNPYGEFLLDLPDHWRQVPSTEQNRFSWESDVADASITISFDYYEVPEAKAMDVARHCLSSRHSAMENWSSGHVTVLQESIKPYSGGGALELTYVSKIPGNTYLYLGYVTERKIFNFALTCGPDGPAAGELYNDIVSQHLRIKLP